MAFTLGSRSSIGYVRGFSMWPNLIPGDILRTRPTEARLLRPGMVAVLPVLDEGKSIVHRIRTVRNFSGSVIVSTYGDRGGKDPDPFIIPSGCSVAEVNGVLRKGRYRKITRWFVPGFLSCKFAVMIFCWIVRRIFW